MRRIAAAVSVALIAAASVGAPAPAHAQAAAALQMNGQTAPGLTTIPTYQAGQFDGTLTGSFDSVTGSVSCQFDFSSTIAETLAQGFGNAGGGCDGVASLTDCYWSYARTGVLVELSGSCIVNGTTRRLTGHAAFHTTDDPFTPVWEFTWTGAVVLL